MSSPAQAPSSNSLPPPPPDAGNSTSASPSASPASSPTNSTSTSTPPPPSPPLLSSSPPPPPSSSSSSSPPPPSPSDLTPSGSLSPPPPPSFLSPPPPPGSVSIPPPPVKLTASPAMPSSSPSPSSSSTTISELGWIGIGVSGAIAVCIVTLCIYCLTKKKRRRQPFPPPQSPYYPPTYPNTPSPNPLKANNNVGKRQQWDRPSPPLSEVSVQRPPTSPPFSSTSQGDKAKPYLPSEPPSLGSSRSWFTFEELQVATDNFSPANLLGEGGFGCVYMGTLSSGQVVAVKQLRVGGGQGEREFRAEVEIISRVHHRHLVSLVGYCIMENQRLLVYEYVPNRTLEYHLHGKGRPVLNWQLRQRIALGAARGIAYLHEDCHPRIIHRDIKSSNILIDNNFEVQVSDFGLAKLNSDANTHVTTRVMGTFGYLAPEYAATGKLTEKSDVFSFGVVLLELITGRKSVDPTLTADGSLVEWARPVLAEVLEQNNLDLIVDPKLNGDYDEKEMMRMVEAAAASVRYSAHKRPRMGLVVRALEEESTISDLNKGVKPGRSILYQEAFGGSSDYDSSQYSADMRKFHRLALGSQEYGSEYSGTASEYGGKSSTYGSEYQSSREVDRSGPKSQMVRPTVAPSTRDNGASPTRRGMNI